MRNVRHTVQVTDADEEKPMKYSTLMSIGAVLFAAAALPAGAAEEERAVLHFADMNGIKDWRPTKGPEGTDAILIEGRNGNWFRATFFAPCPEVKFAPAISFVTDTLGNLDEFTSIMVEGKRCDFKTFERTGDPDEQRDAESDTGRRDDGGRRGEAGGRGKD
jgi:hypothetical protein